MEVEPQEAAVPCAPAVAKIEDRLDAKNGEMEVDDTMVDRGAVAIEEVPGVGEYTADIYKYLDREVLAHLPQPDYMQWQPNVNGRMRAILVDWLVEVHVKYKLRLETLFLSVNLVDRYLERNEVARSKLQLVGVAATLIASKFEEIFPPEINDFTYICDNAYTKEQIMSMEVTILNTLSFIVAVPTAAHFFQRYRQANGCDEAHGHLFQYILELSLPEVGLLRYAPSHVAAAACLLSNKLLRRQPSWRETMVTHTGNTQDMLKDCARVLCGLVEAAKDGQCQAVRKKFSQEAFLQVAKMIN
jgi:hypothetical protein